MRIQILDENYIASWDPKFRMLRTVKIKEAEAEG